MDGLILDQKSLPQKEYQENKPPTNIAVYLLAEQDSNGDHQFTDADIKKIAVSDPSGKNYREVVEKADRLNHASLISPDRLLIIYSLNSTLNAVELNPQQLNAPINAYEIIMETQK